MKIALIVIGLMLLLLTVKGAFNRIVLMSDVEGVVLKDGVPVEGAEVVQQISLDEPNDVPETIARTDAQGKFDFLRVTKGPGIRRLIPVEPSVLQRILIRYKGVEYEAWRHSKHSYEPDSELNEYPVQGRKGPLKLVCELSNKPDFEGNHYGVCKLAAEQ